MRRLFLISVCLAAVGCGDRAFDADLEARIDAACEAQCQLLNECIPTGPLFVTEEQWAQNQAECMATCPAGLREDFENSEHCPDAKLELLECFAESQGCEDYRGRYFMDGPVGESCYAPRESMHECSPAIDLPAPQERWPGIPTP